MKRDLPTGTSIRVQSDTTQLATGSSAQHPQDVVGVETDIGEPQQTILELRKLVHYLEKDLADKQQLLISKEAIIKELETFQRSFIRHGIKYRLVPFLQRFPLTRQLVDRCLLLWRDRVGVFVQHDPRPLRIPKHYSKSISVSTKALPTVSIVTPSFNHGEFLERTINSVISQDYPHVEYIVQDNLSTDQTQDILEQYRSRLARVDSRSDTGQANAINAGFAYSTGVIMAYLNSDDILLPGAIPYVANYFANHPEVDVVYGHRVCIDVNDNEVGRWVLPPHDDRVLVWADYVPQETMFWRRESWEKAGGYIDESFKFALDWDLLLRFRESGAKIARLPRFLGAFRIHHAQKTQAWYEDVGLNEMDRLRLRCHGRSVTWQEVNRNIRSFINASRMYHALYRLGISRY